MKTKFTIIILIISTIVSNGQILTFDELILLQKKDVTFINDYLLKKEWSYIKSEFEYEDNYNHTIWGYNPSSSTKAELWFTLYFSETKSNYISYETSSEKNYILIKNKIDSYGMKKINSIVKSNKIITDYEGKNYVARILCLSGNYDFPDNEPSSFIINLYIKNYYYNYVSEK